MKANYTDLFAKYSYHGAFHPLSTLIDMHMLATTGAEAFEF